MSGIGARLSAVRARIAAACARAGRDPGSVELLAVSKTRPPADVLEAHAAGQRLFGENRVQELVTKAEAVRDADVEWHMIGSLQTNKVRALLAVPGLGLLQSVDRPKLVDALARELAAQEVRLPVLVQVRATDEPTKHGVDPSAAPDLARQVVACPRLELRGLMAIGPLAGDARPAFAAVAALRERLRDALGLPLPTLSLGMTQDLEAAIAAGSTLVRVGTAVFGERPA